MTNKTLLRKISIFAGVALFCLGAGVVAISCQGQDADEEAAFYQKDVASKAHQSYLTFTSEYTGIGEPSIEDQLVILEAMGRVKASKVNGVWQMNMALVRKANLSPEVLQCLNQIIGNSNRKLSSRSSVMVNPDNVRMVPKAIIVDEDPFGTDPGPSDCVARCIGRIYSKLGFGPSYAFADSYITTHYGNNGVDPNRMGGLLNTLYGSSHVSSYSVNDHSGFYSYSNPNAAVILNYRTDEGGGHSVIYMGTSTDGTHMASDPQDGNSTRFVDPGQVISAYQVSK